MQLVSECESRMKNNKKHRVFSANKYTLDEHDIADMMTIRGSFICKNERSPIVIGNQPPKFFLQLHVHLLLL